MTGTRKEKGLADLTCIGLAYYQLADGYPEVSLGNSAYQEVSAEATGLPAIKGEVRSLIHSDFVAPVPYRGALP